MRVKADRAASAWPPPASSPRSCATVRCGPTPTASRTGRSTRTRAIRARPTRPPCRVTARRRFTAGRGSSWTTTCRGAAPRGCTGRATDAVLTTVMVDRSDSPSRSGTSTKPTRSRPTPADVEALGYEELYSYDHIGAVDPFAPLLPAAAATERLRVGPLVLNNEFHHPALLARTAATVDRMTGGGSCSGSAPVCESEHESIGSRCAHPARGHPLRRVASRSCAACSTTAPPSSTASTTTSLDELGVRPVQERVPFLIGGFGRRVVTIAARYADIFQFTGLTTRLMARSGGWLRDRPRDGAGRLADRGRRRTRGRIERSALVQMIAVGVRVRATPSSPNTSTSTTVLADTPFVLNGTVEQLVDKLERIRVSSPASVTTSSASRTVRARARAARRPLTTTRARVRRSPNGVMRRGSPHRMFGTGIRTKEHSHGPRSRDGTRTWRRRTPNDSGTHRAEVPDARWLGGP